LIQVGVALFLFTSFEGFAIPFFASPLLGRSTHSLSALFGVMLLTLGLSWPRLHVGAATSWIAFWCLLYSGLAITAAGRKSQDDRGRRVAIGGHSAIRGGGILLRCGDG
jgi:hydroxylaminobenzene mutase